jgi:hypothetical protein
MLHRPRGRINRLSCLPLEDLLSRYNVSLIVIEYVLPQIGLPFIEIVLSLVPLGIPFAILVDPLTAKLLKPFVDLLPDNVELLI